MALKVKVDDHGPREVAWESSLSISQAISRAYDASALPLRARSEYDTVMLNGQPSQYTHIISHHERHACIQVETEAFRSEKAKRLGTAPLRRRTRRAPT